MSENGLAGDFSFRVVTREVSIAASNDDEGEMVVFFISVLIVPGGGEVKIPLPPDDVLISGRFDFNLLQHLLIL